MLKQLKTEPLVTCEPDTKISEVARIMAKKNVSTLLILDQGKPRGLITDRDIVLRCVAEHLDVDDTTVENVMTETLETCSQEDGVFDAIRKMQKGKVHRIPLIDAKGIVVSILTQNDLLKLLSQELAQLAENIQCEGGDEDKNAA